jgi:hypothetical protein
MTLWRRLRYGAVSVLAAGILLAAAFDTRAELDTDGDGIPDAREAQLGSNPLHKDLFVECDYMVLDLNGDGDGSDSGEHSHRLLPDAVAIAADAFAVAPVSNPGSACAGGPAAGRPCISAAQCAGRPCSTQGITLHLDQGELGGGEAIPEQRFLDFTSRRWGPNFFDIKAAQFDFGRAGVFHYCLLGHNSSEELGSVSGNAEILGNDFYVTLGSWPNGEGRPLGSVPDQAGTLLHELGHNLGLNHGGDIGLPEAEHIKNRKPNYLSVMSYSFQVAGIFGRFDYSRDALGPLVESDLDEPFGITGREPTRYFCRGCERFVRSAGPEPIDWDCNGLAIRRGVQENVNCDRVFLGTHAYDTLVGRDDWSRVVLDFARHDNPVFDDRPGQGAAQHAAAAAMTTNLVLFRAREATPRTGVDREPELTWKEGRCLDFVGAVHGYRPQDADGDFWGDACDNCVAVFNPGQTDADGNGTGDACEP